MPRLRTLAAVLVLPLLGACHMVDQTTFDPKLKAQIQARAQARQAAANPPKPPGSFGAPDEAPPLLTIRFEQNPDYEAALRDAVIQAVRRKPDVQFRVVTAEPDAGDAHLQLQKLSLDGGDARRVASSILADGIDPGQVQLGARIDKNLTEHEVRVYVQ